MLLTKQDHEKQLNEDILDLIVNDPLLGYREIAVMAGVSVNWVVTIARVNNVSRRRNKTTNNNTLPGVL